MVKICPIPGKDPNSPWDRRWAAGIFALSLAIRLAHLLLIAKRSPFFSTPLLDAGEYFEQAVAIASGKNHPFTVFWHPPGYVYFLASIFRLFGTALMPPLLLQILLGAGTAVLTYRIGHLWFDARVGIIAGVGAAVYGPLVFFDTELLGVSLSVFLLLLGFALCPAVDGQRWRWLGAGIAAGAAAVTNASLLPLALPLALAARKHAGWVLVGLGLVVLPITLRNYRVGGEAVLISSNGGINLFLGNNPDYEKTIGIRPGYRWKTLVNEPYENGVTSQGEASRYFIRKVAAFARTQPVHFLEIQGRKIRLFFGGDEIMRNQAIYPYRQWSAVLATLLWKVPGLAFPFGVILPLSLVGMVFGRRADVLLAACSLLFVVTIAFFVTSRYRLPIVPFLLVFAGEGLRCLWLQPGLRKAATIVLVPAFLAANIGQRAMTTQMNPDALLTLANAEAERGNRSRTIALLEEAVAIDPEYAEAWSKLGTYRHDLGQLAEAEDAYQRALELNPRSREALLSYAALKVRKGDPGAARALYRQVLRDYPGDPVAMSALEALGQAIPPGARGRP